MHDHPGGLIDYEERPVLVDDVQRQLLCRDVPLRFDLSLNEHTLATEHLVSPAQQAPVNLNGSSLDPCLKPSPGVLRQRPGQRLVQAQPGKIQWQLQLMAAELRRRVVGRKSCHGFSYTLTVYHGSIHYNGAKPKKGPQLLSLSGKFARGSLVALCMVLFALGGCRTHRADPTKSSPELLYKKAHQALISYDFQASIKGYEALTARFPFTEQARQARLDLIYAYYRAGEGESATDAAETFIRENPTHPRVDYAWYIKGLVDFERQPNAIEKLFRVDLSQRPPSNARKSFSAFRTVVEQYPKSEYAHDAEQRMVYLRNRLADYEVHVARYYMKRGAFVAAVQRAKGCVENFDGAPAQKQALQIMIEGYDRLGLKELADKSRQVYEFNYGGEVKQAEAETKRPWWKLW
jgi:outer membrane protein assembly factor BamD